MVSNVWARRRVPGERVRLVCLTGQLGYGGSERQVYLALKHLDDTLFERHIVVLNPSVYKEYAEELEAMGVRVWRVPEDCRGTFRRLRFLTQLLTRLKPHIVHSWNVHDNPYAGVAGFLARAPKRIGSVRGSWSSSGLERMGRPSRLLCLHAVPLLVVNAASIARELSVHGVSSSRLVILRNSLDDAHTLGPLARETVLADLAVDGGSRFVIIVGNLRPVKNHLLFIEAMVAVASRFPDVRGVIVGQTFPSEPEWPAILRAKVQGLGLEGVIVFAGFRSDVPRLLPHAAAACVTSNQEGSPNVIVEAMAAGTPVVATNVGGIPELIDDGVTGLLVEPGDVQGMAAALGRVLADEALATQLGAAGRLSVERRFGCTRTASRLAALYLDGLRS